VVTDVRELMGQLERVARSGLPTLRLLRRYRRLRETIQTSRHVRHVFGPKKVPGRRRDVVVASLFLNGMEFLPTFLEHYRRLGVRHFVLMDNGSNDGSEEYLLQQPDVTLLHCELSFHENENIMRRYLCHRFLYRRWCMLVDVDELLDFPGSTRATLKDLIDYLESKKFTGVVGQMLDMFSSRPLTGPSQPNREASMGHPIDDSSSGDATAETAPLSGDLRRDYPLYELADVQYLPYAYELADLLSENQHSNPKIEFAYGGIRGRLFGTRSLLTKHPLFFNDYAADPSRNPHSCDGLRLADISVVLYHYKLTAGFLSRIRSYLQRDANIANGEYTLYEQTLMTTERVDISSESTRTLRSVDELVDAGFLQTSPDFESWLDARAV